VSFEVALVSGDAIRAVENSEEIRQQVDQHSDKSDQRMGERGPVTRTGAHVSCAWDAV
jgi:hypothetical protein